jgi:DNA-binding response OmpR family regulator
MRILLVEDNPRLIELIAQGLASAGYVTDMASNMSDADAFLQRMDYSLIVLDIRLPDGDGRDLLRRIRDRGHNTPVLVVTAIVDTAHRVETLEGGADDYLAKPFDMDELVARVRAILRRPHRMAERTFNICNLVLDLDRMTLEVDGKSIELSRRELNALAILLRADGGLVQRNRLERTLYSFDEEFTPNALEAVISRLRKRLDQAGAAVTITAMRGIGYLLSERK